MHWRIRSGVTPPPSSGTKVFRFKISVDQKKLKFMEWSKSNCNRFYIQSHEAWVELQNNGCQTTQFQTKDPDISKSQLLYNSIRYAWFSQLIFVEQKSKSWLKFGKNWYVFGISKTNQETPNLSKGIPSMTSIGEPFLGCSATSTFTYVAPFTTCFQKSYP